MRVCVVLMALLLFSGASLSQPAGVISQETEEAREDTTYVVDLRAWRRLSPDDFIPGALDPFLGGLGLADANTLRLTVHENGGGISIEWDQRREPGRMQMIQIAKERSATHADTAMWEIHGRGLDTLLSALIRTGLESGGEEGARSQSDRALIARKSILQALGEACEDFVLVRTEDGRWGLVARFQPAVRALSVRSALERVFKGTPSRIDDDGGFSMTLGPYSISGRESAPVIDLLDHASGPALVIALTTEDAEGVARAWGSD